MAAPTTFSFGAGALYLEDSGTPGTYNKVCGFTEGSLTITKETGDSAVPDCDDPDAAVWNQGDVTTQGWSFAFSGVMAGEAMDELEAATLSSSSTNIRLELAGAGDGSGSPAKTLRRYAGAAHITHTMTGSRGQKWQVSVDGTGDGALTISSEAPA